MGKNQKTEGRVEEMLREAEERETFSDALLRIMKERNLTGPEVYKGANVSKSVFSKLTSDRKHTPRKHIALALALSLGLDRGETDVFLLKAGYALSDSIPSDVAVSFCIEEGIRNVLEVNQLLYISGLPLLGSRR